jgi:hypothetical protein
LLPIAELALPETSHATLDETRQQLRVRFEKVGIAL